MKRLFVAIKIIPDEKLLSAYHDIRKRCFADKIKWVKYDLFHLTLKFLGETREEDIAIITDVLKKIAAETKPFTFDLKGLGIFGSSYRPRIIHVNIEGSKNLKDLGYRILNDFDKVGFPKGRQNFVPHLTLGRIKYIQDKKMFQQSIDLYKDANLQQVKVEELILFESILHPSGPEYLILNKFKLL